ncbi:MAG: Gfo/Idh/MocA family oxidoreductase [Lachnospiraceae bacterium]|nr:Gfo/Idh/MocA family oxidoreductase [Lachnospiraceae bacterium]
MEKKILNIAVVGVNSFGVRHMTGIQSLECAKLVAICDTDEKILKQRAEEFNMSAEDCYTDHRELLKREDIDIVTVATPDPVHKLITVDALRAGKHVLCEKPMAMRLDDCKEMVKAQKETGMKLMVGQVGRYTPAFIEAKKLIDDGEIGDLFFVESEYAHDYSDLAGIGGWRMDPVELRQPVTGGGCHAVDLLRWIAGNPSEVFAYSNRKSLTDWPVDDCTVAIMKFPNNVIGKVLTSIGCKRDYTMRTVLYGTAGTIIMDNTSTHLTLYKNDINGDKMYRGQPVQLYQLKIPVNVNNHNVASEIKDLCDAVLKDEPVKTDGVQGASTVAVCSAIVQSANTGEKVTVDYQF